jgi:hypothetical protein
MPGAQTTAPPIRRRCERTKEALTNQRFLKYMRYQLSGLLDKQIELASARGTSTLEHWAAIL